MQDRDTTGGAREVQAGLHRRLGPEGRVRLMARMSEEARAISAAGVRSRHPGWSEARVRLEVLERIYGTDLVRRAWSRVGAR